MCILLNVSNSVITGSFLFVWCILTVGDKQNYIKLSCINIFIFRWQYQSLCSLLMHSFFNLLRMQIILISILCLGLYQSCRNLDQRYTCYSLCHDVNDSLKCQISSKSMPVPEKMNQTFNTNTPVLLCKHGQPFLDSNFMHSHQ